MHVAFHTAQTTFKIFKWREPHNTECQDSDFFSIANGHIYKVLSNVFELHAFLF